MGQVEVSPTTTAFWMRPLSANTIPFASIRCPSGLITVNPIAFWNGLTRISRTCRGIGTRRFADQLDCGSSSLLKNCSEEDHSTTPLAPGGSDQASQQVPRFPPSCALLQICSKELRCGQPCSAPGRNGLASTI